MNRFVGVLTFRYLAYSGIRLGTVSLAEGKKFDREQGKGALLMEIFMNRDQVKGTTKDIAGKVQRKVGEATGSTDCPFGSNNCHGVSFSTDGVNYSDTTLGFADSNDGSVVVDHTRPSPKGSVAQR